MSDPHETAEVPEGGGSVSFERVRLYLEHHPDINNLGPVLDYDDAYVGEDWPRRAYALSRKDIEQILDDADTAERERGEVQEAFNGLVTQQKQWLKDAAEIERLKRLVHSMRHNGAHHHFVYSYQKWSDSEHRYTDRCAVCTKDRGHPAHFFSGSKYLDSREVEKQAVTALKRVVAMLEGMHMPPLTAQNTARELLTGLPGVPEPIEPEEGNA